MISTFINAWKVADLRKKMLFTALIVLIFRIGAAIPVPFTNISGDNGIIDPTGETFMNYLSMMTGEAFAYGTIFALSITPYINSSIIIQLLGVVIPALEKLSKEGEEGRKKIATITRYTTIGLALLQSTAYFIYLRAKDYIVTDASASNGTPVPTPLPEQERVPELTEPDSAGKVESAAITGKITADALRIRSGAGTANAIVGFYYQNDRVSITEKKLVGSVYWGKTSKGWISMEYVLADNSGTVTTQPSVGETQPPSDSESQQTSGGEKKTVIGDCLRIRLEPGTVYKIVGFLYYGDKVTVLETKDVNGTAWGRVANGWICMDYVT